MVAPSKLYRWPVNRMHCSQCVVHPNLSCVEFLLENSYKHTISSMKYFSPLLITPLFIKFKTLNLQTFKEITKDYLQTTASASIAASTIFFAVCLLRNYNGKFTKYSSLFLPCYIGAQPCWFFPKRTLRLFSIATSQATLEALLRHHSNPISRFLLASTVIQTLLFMLNGAIILHFKREHMYTGFWFIQPAYKSESTVENPKTCLHAGMTCGRYLLEGMKSYLLYGIPLDLLNMLFKGTIPPGTKGLLNVCLNKLKRLRFNMTIFFLSYVGIYRLSSCLLTKHFNHCSQNMQHAISAFLSGASYICLNRISFCTLSLVISIQILWQQFCSDRTTVPAKNESLLKAYVKKISFSKLIVPLNVGYLVHCFIYHNHAVNSLGKGFVNAVTDYKTERIYEFFIKNDMESIMKLANQIPSKGFI